MKYIPDYFKKPYLLYIACFSFIGCVKEIDYKFKKLPDKLVVNSILNPTSLFQVYVSRTNNILGVDTTVFINDATVLLYQNNTFYDTLVNKGKGLYMPHLDLYPCEGCVYKAVVMKDGFTTIYAGDTMPHNNINYNVHVTYPSGYDQNNNPIAYFEIHLDDPINKNNYYELVLYARYGSASDYIYYSFAYTIKTDNTTLINEADIPYRPNTILFSDRSFNGTSATLDFKVYDFSFGEMGNPPVYVNNYYVVLRSVSQEYYKYKKQLIRHLYNQSSDAYLDDPLHLLFSGEPVNMYSNVVNGYGVVVGWSGTMKKLQLN